MEVCEFKQVVDRTGVTKIITLPLLYLYRHISKTGNGCPGFHACAVLNNACSLCHVSNYSEVSGNISTTFTNGDVLYLLTTKRVVSEISMDFENKTGNSFQGVGTVGTGNMAQITGVSGKGVHFTGTTGDASHRIWNRMLDQPGSLSIWNHHFRLVQTFWNSHRLRCCN